MIQADADILLAIHTIRHTLHTRGTQVTCRHIYAHQDMRTPRSPAVFSLDPSLYRHGTPHDGPSRSHGHPADELTLIVALLPYKPTDQPFLPAPPIPVYTVYDTPTQLNIECDKIASETTMAILLGGSGIDLPPMIPYPLPGSKALLHIGEVWITAHMRQHILWSNRAHTLRSYYQAKYGWDDSQFEVIDWQIIKNPGTPLLQIYTGKVSNGTSLGHLLMQLPPC